MVGDAVVPRDASCRAILNQALRILTVVLTIPVWYRLDAQGRPDHADPITADESRLPNFTFFIATVCHE